MAVVVWFASGNICQWQRRFYKLSCGREPERNFYESLCGSREPVIPAVGIAGVEVLGLCHQGLWSLSWLCEDLVASLECGER